MLWVVFPLGWPTVFIPETMLEFRGQRDGPTPTAHREDVIRLLVWEHTSDRPAPQSLGLSVPVRRRPSFCRHLLSDQ
jgi:hypothetical protein